MLRNRRLRRPAVLARRSPMRGCRRSVSSQSSRRAEREHRSGASATAAIATLPLGRTSGCFRLYPWSVEIVIGQLHLGAVGGAETYVLTVAEQLQGLGHGVTVFSLELGQSAALGLERGLEIRGSEDELPEACDIVLANDSVTAYRLADHYPTAAMVFVVHADEYDLSVPPQVPEVVQAVVVLHDRVARRVRALGYVPEVVRLRQPVDTKRFLPRTPLRDPARRVLMLGNWVSGDRRDVVFEVCASVGLQCEHRGSRGGGGSTLEPEIELCRADIVIGKGRVIIEAMASGRAAYVYDNNGGDGWVTPDRYALLEADNFGGQAEPTIIDAERLRRDLAGYSRLMGPANRDLAFVNHSANRHAQSLVELFQRLVPVEQRVVAPLREMARLVRVGWLSEWRAVHWADEAQRLRAELDDTVVERDRLARENAILRTRVQGGDPAATRRLGELARFVRAGRLRARRRTEPDRADAAHAGEI